MMAQFNLMHMKMGLNVVQGITQYKTASIEAQMEESARKFNNTMVQLQAAAAKNTLTLNEVSVEDTIFAEAFQQEIVAMEDQGKAEVSAAASGARGQVVSNVLSTLRGSQARAWSTLQKNRQNQLRAINAQRNEIEINAISGAQFGSVSKPSLGTALLGIGGAIAATYEDYNPESAKLSTKGAQASSSTGKAATARIGTK